VKFLGFKILFVSRFIGAIRDIAEFERQHQSGPIVKVVPRRSGKGAVLAVLSDPNYSVSSGYYRP
jgi:hypothetical protein